MEHRKVEQKRNKLVGVSVRDRLMSTEGHTGRQEGVSDGRGRGGCGNEEDRSETQRAEQAKGKRQEMCSVKVPARCLYANVLFIRLLVFWSSEAICPAALLTPLLPPAFCPPSLPGGYLAFIVQV